MLPSFNDFRSRLISTLTIMMLGTIPTLLKADASFELVANGQRLEDMVGRTLVGVTRDGSKPWSLYLAEDQNAYFSFSTGTEGTATWRISDNEFICFRGLLDDKSREICKHAPSLGRGLDWRTVENMPSSDIYVPVEEEHRGSSQIVYSHSGNHGKISKFIPTILSDWRGRTVVGRTLQDRETWIADFHADRTVEFVYESGLRVSGTYTATSEKICLSFPDRASSDGCRKLIRKDGKLMWASDEGGGYISEVVYSFPAAAEPQKVRPAPVQQVAPEPLVVASEPENLPRDTSEAFSELSSRQEVSFLGEVVGQNFAVVASFSKGKFLILDSRNGQEIQEIVVQNGISSPHLAGSYLAWLDDYGSAHLIDFNSDERLSIKDYHLGGEIGKSIIVSLDGEKLAVVTKDGNRVLFQNTDAPFERFLFTPSYPGEVSPVVFAEGGQAVLHFKSSESKFSTLWLVDANENGTKAKDYITTVSDNDVVVEDIDADESSGMITILKENSMAATTVMVIKLSGGRMINYGDVELPIVYPVSISISQSASEALALNMVGEVVYLELLGDQRSGFVKTSRDIAFNILNHIGHLNSSGDFAIYEADRRLLTLHSASPRSRVALEAKYSRNDAKFFSIIDRDRENRETLGDLLVSGQCDAFRALLGEADIEYDLEYSCEDTFYFSSVGPKVKAAEESGRCQEVEHLMAPVSDSSLKERVLEYCLALKEFNDLSVQLVEAVESGECETVAVIEEKLDRNGFVPICELNAAMQLESPREMYFAAVGYDTAGDTASAIKIYKALMKNFTTDDLALKAAERLLVLSDAKVE